ncbi:iron-sulfur cluster binding protein [Oleiphilus messinensis]|uniref:Iron-sulfur cluster binding protein n=1 Tax=Oleiphilus messinensis TaxID=141451 RepID=A0A1Y0I8F8_9GAMM|nr:LutB/LldF family L-lactate oxidation iron-sulfur protein [Oleiphilus messinensis]ARU55683.1 iron-sulfur cluster binding protein [Oleiphilus messinensis]
MSAPFRDQAIHALQDEQLRENFRGAMDFLQGKRKAVFSDTIELENLRQQGHQIKAEALANLPELLEQLDSQCSKNGIQVHWAETPEQACEIIHGIIEQNNGKLAVKGKSMVSEEIGLNHYLEARGIECLESDMGEYIVQLAQETPSHIIMPAIHKSKSQIATLFNATIPDTPYTENVDELIGTGRRILREKFQKADIGISGVNFAVAETGTLCLVENEGNGRMCTTVPPVHIAITGIEKVIPRLSDLPPLLSLLTRSATGQLITTYFNLISSPRKPDEKDGPEAVHLVLLDNGRSRMYQHPELRETLRCIRCGACMNHCPVYTRIGGHAYGTVYPGPIGQVVMPQINGLDQQGEMTEGCSLNGACGEVCPVEIPLPDLIRKLREERVQPQPAESPVNGAGSHRTRVEATAWRFWRWVYQHPELYRIVTWWATRLGSMLPNRLGPWTRTRVKPVIARQSLHEIMRERSNQPD